MAEVYLSNSPETQKLWSKRLWSAYRRADAVWNDKFGFVGDDPDENPFVVIDDPSRSVGDEVTITLSLQISGRGVIGDEVLEGKEIPIETETFKIKIDEQVQGVKTRGRMNNQRVSFDTLEEGKKKLKDWWKTRRAVTAINHLCGNTMATDLAYTGLNTVAAPDNLHIYRQGSGLGAGTDATVHGDNTQKFAIEQLDMFPTIAEQLPVPIKPFIIDGNPYYGYFIHPNCVEDMRVTSGKWFDVMKNALAGGMHKNNPIFTRALGMWRNVLLFSEPHITNGNNAGAYQTLTRRNVFFGAGALAVAYGRHDRGGKEHFRWYSGTWDHGRKYYASAGQIWGVKSTRFNDNGTARDYGKIIHTVHAIDRVTGIANIGQ
jgi:N4-gp56 family major capsid protein